jgi:hypothetical protein
MYISEWDHTQRCDYYQQLVHKGEIYTQDMAFLHVYQNGICAATATTSSLCHKEKYTPRTWHPCISEWDLHGAQQDYYQQLVPQGRNNYAEWDYTAACDHQQPATREKYTPRDMASSMYISEWDLHGAATSYYQQLVPQGRNIHPTWHSCIYQNGIYTVQRCDYYYQLVPQGRNIHPGTWHSSMYISEWDLPSQRCDYYQQRAARENIHPGTWHSSMYIPVNGIYTVPPPATTSSLYASRENIRGTWHSPCISEWDLHGAALRLLPAASVPQVGEIQPRTWHLHVYNRMGSHGAATQLLPAACEKYTPIGHGDLHVYQNGSIPQPPRRLLPAASATREKYTP